MFIDASNCYGRSNIRNWTDITNEEFKIFLAIIIVLGVHEIPSRRKAWLHELFGITYLRTLMTWIRFEQILSAWRYLPEDERPQGRQSPFRAVNRFIATLAHNFQSRYHARQRLDIDEQCIPFKGRHSSRCYNSAKPCKFHLKYTRIIEVYAVWIVECGLGRNS